MNKERKRSGYHFEFINPRQTKKYKFYFFDYLYYMGEVYHENKWGESSWRMSGFSVLIWYWGLILYPFLSIGLGYIENSDTELAIMCGWGMFPVFFCFFRYRKARKYALMNYYEGKNIAETNQLFHHKISPRKVIYTASAKTVIFSNGFNALKMRMQYILLFDAYICVYRILGFCFFLFRLG